MPMDDLLDALHRRQPELVRHVIAVNQDGPRCGWPATRAEAVAQLLVCLAAALTMGQATPFLDCVARQRESIEEQGPAQGLVTSDLVALDDALAAMLGERPAQPARALLFQGIAALAPVEADRAPALPRSPGDHLQVVRQA